MILHDDPSATVPPAVALQLQLPRADTARSSLPQAQLQPPAPPAERSIEAVAMEQQHLPLLPLPSDSLWPRLFPFALIVPGEALQLEQILFLKTG